MISDNHPKVVHHSGGTIGFNSDYAHYLDEDVGIVVLSMNE